jgi:hypothetical protein
MKRSKLFWLAVILAAVALASFALWMSYPREKKPAQTHGFMTEKPKKYFISSMPFQLPILKGSVGITLIIDGKVRKEAVVRKGEQNNISTWIGKQEVTLTFCVN